MKILVTGATSRQCNPEKNSKDVMISWLIAEACRELGYEVEHRNPSVIEDLSSFDHVFVGMAPLHAMGSNRAYGALSAILRAYGDGKLTLYLDDVDTSKVANGIKNVMHEPKRLTKEFFNYKIDWAIAAEPKWRDWLLTGVEMLYNYPWPRTLVPQFSWATGPPSISTHAGLTEVVTFDPTPLVPEYLPVGGKVDQLWVTEHTAKNRWFARQRPVLDIRKFDDGANKRPDDKALVNVYASSWGVLDAGLPFGWWHSRIEYAYQAETLYVTDWQNHKDLGDPYALLPDAAAMMSLGDRQMAIDAQLDLMDAVNPEKDDVLQKIAAVVKS